MVRIEDILFWILIFVIVGMAVWLAFGSPEFEKSLMMIIIFVAGSELLVWRALFAFDKGNAFRLSQSDKRTAIGFERVKLDFERVNNRLSNIEKDIGEIKSIVKRK